MHCFFHVFKVRIIGQWNEYGQLRNAGAGGRGQEAKTKEARADSGGRRLLKGRSGQCLLRWLNDVSNGAKSFVPGLNFVPIDAEDKGFDPT